MYLEHFDIKQAPFTLTPNTEFYCNLETHEAALNMLLYGLTNNEGFIKVTGEVGSGKTLLCRKLLNSLNEKYVSAYIPSPDLSPNILRKTFAEELGVDTAALDEAQLRKELVTKLLLLNQQGKNVVLIIDEAQTIPDDSLEAIRLLTNLETESHKLLQIIMFGQPELDARLKLHKFRQLAQRITFSYQLNFLTKEDIQAYVFHRISIAGYRKGALFSPGAMKLLNKSCSGTPRLINILCQKALMASYGKGEHKVSKRAMQKAIQDTIAETKQASPITKPLSWLIGVGISILLLAACYLHYIGKL